MMMMETGNEEVMCSADAALADQRNRYSWDEREETCSRRTLGKEIHHHWIGH